MVARTHLHFEITSVIYEKRVDGNATVKAECIEDGIDVEIIIKHCDITDKGLIRQKLLEKHIEIIKAQKPTSVSVGEII